MQQAATEHKGATVADEGKRYARDGHETDGHGDVDEHMHGEQHRHADGDEGAEAISSETGDADAIEQNQTKQAENREASQESFFLGDDRENKIVMRDRARQVPSAACFQSRAGRYDRSRRHFLRRARSRARSWRGDHRVTARVRVQGLGDGDRAVLLATVLDDRGEDALFGEVFEERNHGSIRFVDQEQRCRDERRAAMEKLKGKPEITRFKGLGEISPDEFKHFIGQDIRLDPVLMDKATSVETLLEFYMGKNTPDRQEFIINNLKVELDVVE